MAIAVNEEFVSKGRWKDFYLKNGDRLEVLAPMVGG
jgi:thiamine biosynthesis protein ThiS